MSNQAGLLGQPRCNTGKNSLSPSRQQQGTCHPDLTFIILRLLLLLLLTVVPFLLLLLLLAPASTAPLAPLANLLIVLCLVILLIRVRLNRHRVSAKHGAPASASVGADTLSFGHTVGQQCIA